MTMRIKQIFLIAVGLVLIQACQKEPAKAPSAADNVFLVEQSFEMPGLDRQRKLRIYLPPDYEKSESKYPVLYMHDGQNLFDDATSYAGEWGVDETLNKLSKQNKLSLIVVGIDNSQDKRMNELSPWENADFGVAEGKQYMDFIVKTIKPIIDKRYRTLPDQQNTAIMGSSMGGLISHYAIFEYSNVFSKAGIFSPSFWYADKVYAFSQASKLNQNARLYFIMGSDEGGNAVGDMQKMVTQLKQQNIPTENVHSKVISGGEHNEKLWREQFEHAILWLFAPTVLK